MTPKATAAKKATRPRKAAAAKRPPGAVVNESDVAAKRPPGAVVNESDVEMYYPTLGVTLQPGESYTPKAKE